MMTNLIQSLIYPISSDYSIYSDLYGVDEKTLEGLLEYFTKTIPRFEHYAQKRVLEKVATFLALKELLGAHSWEEMEIRDYKKLPCFPEWHLSISHDKNFCGVALAKRDRVSGIGIDIEPLDRVISEKTEKFWINEKDIPFSHFPDEIYAWCLKEAAFKALWPSCSNLKEIVLAENGIFYLESNPKKKGFSQFSFYRTKKSNTHLICSAVIPLSFS